MSSQSRKLGLRYAKAFIRASSDMNVLKSDLQVLEDLDKAISGDSSIKSFFHNPVVETSKKVDLLSSIFTSLGASQNVAKFLEAIVVNGRVFALADIVLALRDLSMDKLGIVRVEVKSARELSDSEKSDVENVLSSKIGSKLTFTWMVEPSLIGGFVATYDGVVVDASIEGRLKGMEKGLLA